MPIVCGGSRQVIVHALDDQLADRHFACLLAVKTTLKLTGIIANAPTCTRQSMAGYLAAVKARFPGALTACQSAGWCRLGRNWCAAAEQRAAPVLQAAW